MTKKTVLKRFLPVLLILVVIVCAVVIFSKCSSKQTVPYGSVGQDTYFSYKVNGETLNVSKQELYDRLRYEAYDVVVTEIETAMFKDYIDQVREESKDKNSKLYKDLIKQIDSDCFGTTSKKAIDKLKDHEIRAAIKKFYDSLAKSGYNFIGRDGSYDFNIENIYREEILETYFLSFAKEKFAKEKLLVEINDEENENYIEDMTDDKEDSFDSNQKNQGDVQALIVKFDSRIDAQSALKELQIKFIKGLMYYVPRGDKSQEDYDKFYANAKEGDQNGTSSVTEISEELEILLQYVRIYNATYQYKQQITLKSVALNAASTYADVQALANQYKNDFASEEIAKENLIKDILSFDEAYDKDDDGNIIKDADDKNVTNDKLTKNVFSFTQSELTSFDQSISTYVYSTLRANTYVDEANKLQNDFYKDGYQSTPKEQSASSGYFLAYKFLDANPFSYDEMKRLKDTDEFKDKWTSEFEKGDKDAYDDVIESKLTQTYVDEKVKELYKEIYDNKDLLIYDPLIQVFYKYNNEDYSKTNKKSNDNVLSLNYTYTTTVDGNDKNHEVNFELKVDYLFEKLEKLYGVSTSYDIATGKLLDNMYKDELSSTDLTDLDDELENLLASFSQGGMESNGYPAAIGKQAFLQVYLKVSSSKEAIERVYKRSKYEEKFEEDLKAQASLFNYAGYTATDLFGELVTDKSSDAYTDNLYKAFAQIAKTYYDDYASLKYKNILISTDFNNDGKQDDPDEYDNENAIYEYNGNNYTLKGYIENLAAELINLIIAEVDKAATMDAGLTTVNSEYSEASKYSTSETDEKTKKYGKFKRAGLQIKLETEATSTNASSLVKPFLDNLNDFYKYIIKDDQNNKTGWKNEIYGSAIQFTSFYNDAFDITTEATPATLLTTEYGFHALYVTGFDTATSTKWNYETDNVTLQGNKIYSEIYDNKDNDYATVAQIKTYFEENKDGMESLPAKVKTGLSACLQDKYSKFTTNDFRSYMMYLLISNNEGKFESENAKDFAMLSLQITKNSLNGYNEDTTTPSYKANELWWSMFS